MRLERRFYGNKPTVDEAVKAKMKVLREFYIVDKSNEHLVEQYLRDHINAHPDKDFEAILDRVAHELIAAKLNSVQ